MTDSRRGTSQARPLTHHADLMALVPDGSTVELGRDFPSAGTAVNVNATVSRRLRGVRRITLWRARWWSGRMRRTALRMDADARIMGHRLEDPDLALAEKRAAAERALVTTPTPESGPHAHSRLGIVLPMRLLSLRWAVLAGMVIFDATYLVGFFLNVLEGPENPTWGDLSNPKVLASIVLAVLPTTVALLLSEFVGKFLAHRIDRLSRDHARNMLPWVYLTAGAAGLVFLSLFLHEVAASRFAAVAAFAGAQGGMTATIWFLTLLPWVMAVLSLLGHLPRYVEVAEIRRHTRSLHRMESRAINAESRLHHRFDTSERRFERAIASIQVGVDSVGQVADSQVIRVALAGHYGPATPDWAGQRVLSTEEAHGSWPAAKHGAAADVPFTVTGRPATLVAPVTAYLHPELDQVLAEARRARGARAALPDTSDLFESFRARAQEAAGVEPASPTARGDKAPGAAPSIGAGVPTTNGIAA